MGSDRGALALGRHGRRGIHVINRARYSAVLRLRLSSSDLTKRIHNVLAIAEGAKNVLEWTQRWPKWKCCVAVCKVSSPPDYIWYLGDGVC